MGLEIRRSHVAEFRAAQAGVASFAVDDLRGAWANLNLANPAAARDSLLQVTPAITTQWSEVGASVAAEWYGDMRATVGVPGPYSPVMAPPAPAAWVERQVRFGAQHLWTDNPTQTLLFLQGAVVRYALGGARDTITQNVVADPRAVGWQRITKPGACAFCRMLSERGAVYKRATVGFAAHNNCGCIAVQSWDADAPEVSVRTYAASERTSNMSDEQLERHRANIRRYLADFD